MTARAGDAASGTRQPSGLVGVPGAAAPRLGMLSAKAFAFLKDVFSVAVLTIFSFPLSMMQWLFSRAPHHHISCSHSFIGRPAAPGTRPIVLVHRRRGRRLRRPCFEDRCGRAPP